jgi:hypothetical protein
MAKLQIDLNKFSDICSNEERWESVMIHFPGFTKRQLQRIANKNKILLKSINWTNNDLDFLKDNYDNFSNLELSSILKRTKGSIDRMSQKLNLTKSKEKHYESFKKNSLSKLLEENPISFYYIGYLIADGYFSDKVMSIDISKKDSQHLQSMLDFLDYKNVIRRHRNNVCIEISDSNNLPKIRQKFQLLKNKTLNPPTIDYYKIFGKDLYYSLIIGIIDGDGNIRKSGGTIQITLEIHKSWFNFLSEFLNHINDDVRETKSKVRLTKRGYASLTLCGNSIHNFFIRVITDNQLPVLNRKWYQDL